MAITPEQQAAIERGGKVIVSASAGSGKTFVMIKKLVEAIANGADLDGVLAVTFTKKAAAQIKEKLRTALMEKM
ncbi:MAG: UvrD-helicase domain-containing protein, partial [Clostridia bacterium]|nr:UvrD-helicase domain-containing protein [Clostridia bacterium]